MPRPIVRPLTTSRNTARGDLILAGADTKTKPGDDFFRYANGTWIDKTQIPPDKPAYSLRLAMTDLTEQRLHEMMETLAAKDVTNPSTLEEKVAAFYRSFMDEARIEQLGTKPIESVLSEVKKAETRDDLAALMGRESLDYESALFSYGIDVDLKDPSKYAFYLRQSGAGLAGPGLLFETRVRKEEVGLPNVCDYTA